jgi:hypothetical protein
MDAAMQAWIIDLGRRIKIVSFPSLIIISTSSSS